MKLSTFLDHAKTAAEQSGDSMPAILRKLKLVGYESVEVWPEQLADAELMEQVRDAGLSPSGVPVWCDFAHKPFSSRDLDVLETVKSAHAESVLLVPSLLEENDDSAAALEKTIEGFRAMTDACLREGLQVAIEDFDHDRSVLCTLEGVRAVLDAVPGLGLCLDTGNFIVHGESPLEILRTHGSRLCRLHAKDRATRPFCGKTPFDTQTGETWYPCPVGAGKMPIAEILREARDLAFDGTVVVECFNAEPMYPALVASANYISSI